MRVNDRNSWDVGVNKKRPGVFSSSRVTFGGDAPEGIESRFPSIGDASTRTRATYGRH